MLIEQGLSPMIRLCHLRGRNELPPEKFTMICCLSPRETRRKYRGTSQSRYTPQGFGGASHIADIWCPLESELRKGPLLTLASVGFWTLGGDRMSDQGAPPEAEIATGASLPHSSVSVPDWTQRAAILGQVSGGILHEFNNILTVISGTIDILAQAVIDRPELAAITRLIDEAALRGARLTSHLIAFERGQPPQSLAVDVSALLSDAARLLRPVLGGRSEIAVTSSSDPMMAVVDPGLLMAAILKLAIAARNAMPDGGLISMAAARAGVDARGDVVDEAIEIKVDAVETGGSPAWGVGDLDAIEELVRLSGGDIAIDRQVDRIGFEIRLHKAHTRD